jgi:O-antigen ligase
MNRITLQKAITISWSLIFLLFPLQLGKHFWPDWSMVLGRRVDYLSPTLYVTDILMILPILLSVFFLLTNKKAWTKSILLLRQKRVLGILGLVLGGIVCNCLFSLIPINSLLTIVRWGLLFSFAIVGIGMIKDTRKLTYLYIYAMVASSFLALWQVGIQKNVGGILYWFGERSFSLQLPGIAKLVFCLPQLGCQELLRPYATFPHPNVLAGALVIAILLVIASVRAPLLNKLALLGLFSGTLLLTASRSAIAALCISVLYMFLKNHTRVRFFFLMLSAMIISSITLPYQIPQLVGEESVTVRQNLVQAAIEIIVRHPLAGVGLGNFLAALPSFIPSREIYFLQPVHNIYLLFLSEVGALGMLLLIVVCFSCTRICTKILNAPLFPVTLSILFIGLLDHYPLTLQQGRLLLFIAFFFTLSSLHFPSYLKIDTMRK